MCVWLPLGVVPSNYRQLLWSTLSNQECLTSSSKCRPGPILIPEMNSKNKQLADLLLFCSTNNNSSQSIGTLGLYNKNKRENGHSIQSQKFQLWGYKSLILDHFYGKYNTQECVRQHTTLLGGRVVKCTGTYILCIQTIHAGSYQRKNH